MYSTLLWATDGSPESDHALGTALALLEPGGHLIAYHCDQRFLGHGVGDAPVVADELERQRHIAAQVDDLRARGIAVSVRMESTVEAPPAKIADAALSASVDAIVCGTRGLRGIRALANGSVAARLLRNATVPVIVVPAVAGAQHPAVERSTG